MTQPTVGRIVHYHAGDGIIRPAMITHVWETSVNLSIFNDGSYEPNEPAVVYATSVIEGPEIGQWSWPVIE